ncbi:hypothetical protein EG329_000898 [Mollisiaceae sp. DMI_Dod_QoI]|nr:hypothetical protein EG329_000898 [Helotiales sp. DMI_Dod_QoI]
MNAEAHSMINHLAEEIERLRSSVTGSGAIAAQPMSQLSLPSNSTTAVDLPHPQQERVLPEAFLTSATPDQPLFLPSEIAPGISRPIEARILGPVQLSPEVTIDLFQIFFKHYHHFLDILDPFLTPDLCYSTSPVLFWAIISVAARHYDQQSNLFSSLGQPVTSLIWSTISALPHSQSTIQAVLLISLWPFPTNSMATDISFMLVTIAKTAAMQLGVHRPEIVQDFLRVKTRLDADQFQKAVRLWAGCYIASQCVSASIGHPSILPSDWVIDQACDIDNQYTLPDNIRYHLLICKFIARANSVMAEREGKTDEIEGLTIVAMLEGDFEDLEHRIGHKITVVHQILLSMASLQLRTYYFFIKHNTEVRKQGLLRAYATAISLIKKCADAESSWGFAQYAPDGWNQNVSMAAMLIMKIVHSSYARYINTDEGEQAFNLVISLMRKALVQKVDVRFRVSVVLAQLWGVHHSLAARKDQEPSLNIRSRLGASILHDTLWQWRENFGRGCDPYPSTVDPAVSVGQANKVTESCQQTQSSLFDEQPRPDDIASAFENDSFIAELGDADWIWDVGFPSFLPIDIDSNSPSLPSSKDS